MSSDFQVYPYKHLPLVCGDLLAEFKKNINNFFLQNDIHITMSVEAGFYNTQTNQNEIIPHDITLNALKQRGSLYMSYEFTACNKKIVDYTYIEWYSFDDDASITAEYLFDDKQNMISDIEERMPYIINAGGYWKFNGRATPAYGFAAASFAKLTDGIIFSDSSAWSYSKFPCLANDFLKFYYNIHDLSNEDNDIFETKQYLKEIKIYEHIINGNITTYPHVNYDISWLYVVKLFLDLHYDIQPSPDDSYSYHKYAEINGKKALLYFVNTPSPIQIDCMIDAVNRKSTLLALCIIDNTSLFLHEKYRERIKRKLYTLTARSKKYKRNIQTVYLVTKSDEIWVFT